MIISRKPIARFVRKVIYRRYALVYLNGFLLATLLYLYTEDNYEKKLFEALASYVKERTTDLPNFQESTVQQCLHLTYYLGKRRTAVFKNKEIHSFKASFIHPVTYDLMATSGACGSYAYILSRLLNELNIPNRIAQMKVNGLYGGHIIVEAKTSKGWVVLDPSYDLYFRKTDGSMASFVDVQGNWEEYRKQIPANYDTSYRYEGVRYANWNKIPVLMPLMKKASYFFLGKESTEAISFRTLVLRKFHLLFQITGFIYLLIIGIIIRNYIRRNRKARAVQLATIFNHRHTIEKVPVEE